MISRSVDTAVITEDNVHLILTQCLLGTWEVNGSHVYFTLSDSGWSILLAQLSTHGVSLVWLLALSLGTTPARSASPTQPKTVLQMRYVIDHIFQK